MPSKVCKQLIDSNTELVMYITGGGTEAIPELLDVGGASKVLLEAVVPYSTKSLHEILGYTPKHYACEETARAMAMKAYQRAKTLCSDKNKNLMGLGATSKLYSLGERPNRQHEVHIAVQTAVRTTVFSANITDDALYYISSAQGIRRRIAEEHINTDMIVGALQDIVMYGERTSAIYPLATNTGLAYFPLRDNIELPPTQMIFPGSFNPVHHQHLKIADVVYARTGIRPWFEISIQNTNKPDIDAIDLDRRISKIGDAAKNHNVGGVVVSRTPLFIDKAKQYTNPTFIVGADTINRIDNPDYYHDAAQFVQRRNLRFLVFNRKGFTISRQTLNNLNIEVIPDTEYLDDGTSSTFIRNNE